jgi:zinc D-Ala-D-Ala carboxypeptidase
MKYYISDHISWDEATSSATAKANDIDNIPNAMHVRNMKKVAQRVFEPLRDWVGGAIKVTSFYRSEALCEAIGSSRKSQHITGQAIDIDDTFGHKTNAEMFEYLKDEIDFDQLIWEFGDEENPDWLHISYVSPQQNRNQILVAYRDEDDNICYKFYAQEEI